MKESSCEDYLPKVDIIVDIIPVDSYIIRERIFNIESFLADSNRWLKQITPRQTTKHLPS